ncbi:MAG: 4a-hydroxytetrahydrobiopterin dehydratase [Pseudomonadales bacterium]|jgi:4a-hydroxytetrahydrobiopterin dehydratase|nr:4a-hydroxytetrahydrobiopterin dehydratase [Pseudomonadales bacterium]MDP7360771.1 4a-hydroxytetrahydrobiopterin dehydratase [Pseudomonadales bacterium]MDP7597670.1 4a-hydroxytetrahydrobiopterin dehydratase [Pseudomonadales bacterium]HJN50644.1 4a-hydroxytetrahydrobiopterin dehydratase [Pseudomonadales bacterium]|tara:strand:- start:441 stop:803 length:363 start_codon:yes stop_codon:yes gene_type:complete
MDLSSKQCIPCRGGVSPLKGKLLDELHDQLNDGWEIVDEHHLTRSFRFKDFTGALVYVNRIGEMANEQQHHPDIYLAWGKVRVDVWTHKIDGLTESDFIFAARADQLVESQEPSRNAGQQ